MQDHHILVDANTGETTFVPMTDAEILERSVSLKASTRRARDAMISRDVDPIVSNPLRWAALTAEQQQAWVDYRQALLDIPQQSGFPHDVVWPTKPEV